jgi:hypothetical protein
MRYRQILQLVGARKTATIRVGSASLLICSSSAGSWLSRRATSSRIWSS